MRRFNTNLVSSVGGSGAPASVSPGDRFSVPDGGKCRGLASKGGDVNQGQNVNTALTIEFQEENLP
jgi:hypothetical protein